MTSVTDMFPTVFRKGYRRELLLLCLCAVCFFLGLLLVTEVRDMWEGGSEHSHIPVNCISSSQPIFLWSCRVACTSFNSLTTTFAVATTFSFCQRVNP